MSNSGTKDFGFGVDAPAGPTGQEREALLRRLLGQVQARPAQVAAPAQRLRVEVDGEQIGCIEAAGAAFASAFGVDHGAQSITLRDEAGVVRAHLLPQEQDLREQTFDQGRLVLSLERASGALRLSVRGAPR